MKVLDINNPMNLAYDFDISAECNGLLLLLKSQNLIGADEYRISNHCSDDVDDIKRVLCELRDAGKIALRED